MDELHGLGAELVFIGNGAAFFARAFRDEFHVTVPLLVDEARASYTALGFRRDVASSLNPKMLLHAKRAMAAGFSQKAVHGDARQQGGVLVVDRGGGVVYAYVSDTAGDHPDPAEVVAALRGVAG